MDMIKLSLFPTLVLYFPEFINSKKCDKIFKLLKTKKLDNHPSVIKGKSSHHSNVNTNILSETSLNLNTPLQEYSDHSRIKITNKINYCWFNVQGTQSVLKEHIHPNSILSGSLFVNIGKKASKLYFHNPNPFVSYAQIKQPPNDYTYEWYCFEPKKGDLIIFPSWLRHGSNHNKNFYKDRTVISFNAI